MGFTFRPIVMWCYPGNVPSLPKQSLNLERNTGFPFEMLRTLCMRWMSAKIFSPRIEEVSVSTKIIGTSYMLFLCGNCTIHFPSTRIEGLL